MLFSGFLFGAKNDSLPERPVPPRLVNNLSQEFPDFLSAAETEELETKLDRFNDSTSNQVVIVIVDDLKGYTAAEYSSLLGEKWGVGQKKFDNGVVILIKPTGGAGQRDAFIAVGYGLESVIPDATAKQIVDNEIIANFKNGDFYAGLRDATDVILALAKKEYNYQDYAKKNDSDSFQWLPLILIIFFIILGNVLGFRRRRYTIGGRSFYFGGGSGSSSSSSSGSGFGGFGGGSFGGGGAGGKW